MMPKSMTRSEIRPPRLTDEVGELAPPKSLAHILDKDAQAGSVQLLRSRQTTSEYLNLLESTVTPVGGGVGRVDQVTEEGGDENTDRTLRDQEYRHIPDLSANRGQYIDTIGIAWRKEILKGTHIYRIITQRCRNL